MQVPVVEVGGTMEPLSIILGALVLGAAEATKEIAADTTSPEYSCRLADVA